MVTNIFEPLRPPIIHLYIITWTIMPIGFLCEILCSQPWHEAGHHHNMKYYNMNNRIKHNFHLLNMIERTMNFLNIVVKSLIERTMWMSYSSNNPTSNTTCACHTFPIANACNTIVDVSHLFQLCAHSSHLF